MNIGVLSGKGGTGKTTVATNLTKLLNAVYIDCDVEEPNGFIFLKPQVTNKTDVKISYPIINDDKCIKCGKCTQACEFNALIKTKQDIVLFKELCHGCETCGIVCPVGAISFEKRKLGIIEEGLADKTMCRRGLLNIGEPLAVPVIKALLKKIDMKDINIIDCSPGTSCNVVNTLQYLDMAILVTEPTLFGLHDLKIAVGLVRQFNIPFGIVINKESESNNIIRDYCLEENITIFGSIPYEREIAQIYSNGDMLIEHEKYRQIFENIAQNSKAVFPWN